MTTPEEKPRQKKKTGGLLEGIDSYFDEDATPDQLSPRAGQALKLFLPCFLRNCNVASKEALSQAAISSKLKSIHLPRNPAQKSCALCLSVRLSLECLVALCCVLQTVKIICDQDLVKKKIHKRTKHSEMRKEVLVKQESHYQLLGGSTRGTPKHRKTLQFSTKIRATDLEPQKKKCGHTSLFWAWPALHTQIVEEVVNCFCSAPVKCCGMPCLIRPSTQNV